jgi:hypothetical protein
VPLRLAGVPTSDKPMAPPATDEDEPVYAVVDPECPECGAVDVDAGGSWKFCNVCGNDWLEI